MKILVCVKQVPDTAQVSFDKETGTLIRQGVPSIMNPDDKSALELALKIKDEAPDTHIDVVTMGPAQAQDVLVEALCMGADKGYLLTDRAFAGSDTWATSTALAAAANTIKYDLIICGRQAIDGDTAQVGPQIAEHLNIPHASYIGEVSIKGNQIEAKRYFEDGYQMIKMQTPALLTAISEKIQPRYMNAFKMVDVFEEADITIFSVDDIVVDKAQLGLKGSPTKVKKSVPKASKSQGECVGEDIELGISKLMQIIEKVSSM